MASRDHRDPAKVVECLGGNGEIARTVRHSRAAPHRIAPRRRGHCAISPSPLSAASVRSRIWRSAPPLKREGLLEAELRVRGVAGLECLGSDVDEQAGSGRAKVAALVAGKRLTDVAHGVAATTGVELHAREIDECLRDDRIVARPTAELGRLLEERDRGDRITRARRVPAPLAGDCRLEDDVAAALGEAERGLPVHVGGAVVARRRAPRRDPTSRSTPSPPARVTRRSVPREHLPTRREDHRAAAARDRAPGAPYPAARDARPRTDDRARDRMRRPHRRGDPRGERLRPAARSSGRSGCTAAFGCRDTADLKFPGLGHASVRL